MSRLSLETLESISPSDAPVSNPEEKAAKKRGRAKIPVVAPRDVLRLVESFKTEIDDLRRRLAAAEWSLKDLQTEVGRARDEAERALRLAETNS